MCEYAAVYGGRILLKVFVSVCLKFIGPTKLPNLLSTLLSPLTLRQCKLHLRYQGRVGQPSEIFAASVARKGEVRNVPNGGGEKFGQDPEVHTASVTRKVDITKSWYVTFDPCGISAINLRPTGGQLSESGRIPRGKKSSEKIQNTTGSSAIPTPEEYCKSLNHKPRLRDSSHKGTQDVGST